MVRLTMRKSVGHRLFQDMRDLHDLLRMVQSE